MHIMKYDGLDLATGIFYKTFVLSCGSHDGEHIDLFELQEWFDKNREWINSLKEEVQ